MKYEVWSRNARQYLFQCVPPRAECSFCGWRFVWTTKYYQRIMEPGWCTSMVT